MNTVHHEADNDTPDSKAGAGGRILECARDLFNRDGYERFSMRRLAEAVGCAVGTIYLYFTSKDELFQALVEERFERLSSALSGLSERHRNGDPVVLLKKAMYTYIEFGLRNPDDYRLAFVVRSSSPEEPYRMHPACEMIRFMVGRCVEENRFREVDVETVAQALWAAIHGVTALLIQKCYLPWAGRTKLIEQVINNAVDSLVVEPGLMKSKFNESWQPENFPNRS
jgi:AcrR family transcriptional regulator